MLLARTEMLIRTPASSDDASEHSEQEGDTVTRTCVNTPALRLLPVSQQRFNTTGIASFLL
jgi:hypothetical protein